MKDYHPDTESRLRLQETAFQNLMQRRVHNVLLIASPYDTFMLEEDGRVEEQIYKEYMDLNLSAPPRFIKVNDFGHARQRMRYVRPDLIIVMPGVEIGATLQDTAQLRRLHPGIPTVLLLPFARQVSRRLANEDLSSVDFVFSWLGNVDLILTIIKLIEDKMNAANDILQVGVKSILMVEDTTRFYSAMLPLVYRYLLTQSRNFSTEALNDHERMLRMRARPKVLFTRDYNEAEQLLERYGSDMLGVITDVRYPKDNVLCSDAGLQLTAAIRRRYPFMPVIIASTENSNRKGAADLGALFIDKESKTMPQDLRAAVRRNFGFGDFVVYDPVTQMETMRIHNLAELQKDIFNIPAESLFQLCATNAFSRWLNARALFPIADIIQQRRFTDLRETPAVRQLIFDAIVAYRRMKNRGVVAIYRRDRFDRYSNFARIGQGSLGGKGRGLAFIDSVIKGRNECDDLQGVEISIPRTVVLCTDIFDEFMEQNNLYPKALSASPDSEILEAFLAAELPAEVTADLKALLAVMNRPLAVRSSSLLEDSHYQPFAGVYSTYMVPPGKDVGVTLKSVQEAIKGVYASVFFADSKAYMNATRNLIDQEKMAVILQEVVGEEHDGYYYPTFSGVGRSLNYYPVGAEKTDEGVCEVAVGLGKYIVDGGRALRFSPAHPGNVLQTSTLQSALRDTQTMLYALPMNNDDSGATPIHLSTDDGFNICSLPVGEAAKSGALRFTLSTYDVADSRLRDTDAGPGRKVVTFANVLNHGVFPLPEVVKFMLETGQKAFSRPVEIEFAGMINPKAMGEKKKGDVFWLQIRPIVDSKEMLDDNLTTFPDNRLLLRAATALGHGITDGVRTVVYVDPKRYDSLLNPALAIKVAELNKRLTEEDEPYILMGPGRWGSSDPALGIPVTWPQIAGARLIVESAMEGYRIEPSQGTHFFQNLTSFGVAYFTIDTPAGQGYVDMSLLDSMPALYEEDSLRMVRFEKPLTIAVNGRKSAGAVILSEEDS